MADLTDARVRATLALAGGRNRAQRAVRRRGRGGLARVAVTALVPWSAARLAPRNLADLGHYGDMAGRHRTRAAGGWNRSPVLDRSWGDMAQRQSGGVAFGWINERRCGQASIDLWIAFVICVTYVDDRSDCAENVIGEISNAVSCAHERDFYAIQPVACGIGNVSAELGQGVSRLALG
jgi:hypothetical protein